MSAAGLPPSSGCMADQPWRTPVRYQSYMDWTVEEGKRRLYVFYYEDGSSTAMRLGKLALKLLQRMQRAGLILPQEGDKERAEVRRMELEVLNA